MGYNGEILVHPKLLRQKQKKVVVMEPEDRVEGALGSGDPSPRDGGWEAGSVEGRLRVLCFWRETKRGEQTNTLKASAMW